jgi:nitroreductase
MIALKEYRIYPKDEMIKRSYDFYRDLKKRRSVREFSDREVPRAVIENCVRAAASAPSGANMQPWRFVVVGDADIKRRIREAAEQQEQAFYEKRASEQWLKDLHHLGTDENKPFLQTAPYLIVVFAQRYRILENGTHVKNYYVQESVGIATGMLITAIHNAGLVMLTHTPSPMGFLNKILKRPSNEKPFLILVVGYPARGVKVPDIERKDLQEILIFL